MPLTPRGYTFDDVILPLRAPDMNLAPTTTVRLPTSHLVVVLNCQGKYLFLCRYNRITDYFLTGHAGMNPTEGVRTLPRSPFSTLTDDTDVTLRSRDGFLFHVDRAFIDGIVSCVP
jgi:hypothetical protein